MDLDNIDHLLEALNRDDVPHGTIMDTHDDEHEYNWLDAASPSWLAENADPVILALARKMVIRYTALQEEAFARAGYADSGPIARGAVPEHIIKESGKHQTFYLKTQGRIAKLARLDSINRRSFEVIRFSEAKATTVRPDPDWVEDKTATDKAVRDLYQLYESRRRANITEYASIVHGQGHRGRDWLDDATQAELEAATDTIMSAGAARMALRAALRLEKAWRQDPWVNNEAIYHKTDLVHDLRRERDRAVDSYLKIREVQARMMHNQGIVARSADMTLRKPRRPYAKRKKTNSA